MDRAKPGLASLRREEDERGGGGGGGRRRRRRRRRRPSGGKAEVSCSRDLPPQNNLRKD
ncbi:Hypothetical predicted protein [Podarcis lilfordi]|uniref:Uncharacterized protein n=1 Tax=Podarcis lilfordi TaxID=74358 RepID=A0AA35PRK5_9SAUR|nr:Hypothetical predicted protein [Podarcis lilfordi]